MEAALKVEPAPGDPEFLSDFEDSISFILFCRETMYYNYEILGSRYTNKKGLYTSHRGSRGALEY